jgi:hypothetical protein
MRGSMLARAAGCALAACSFTGLASAADIADLAPRASFLVASIDNWPAIKADFEKNGVVGLWNDKAVRGYVHATFADLGWSIEDLEDRFDSLGVDLEDLPPLGTTAGAAIFMAPKQGVDGRALDGDLAENITHVLVVAELDGGEAEDGRDLWQIVEEALERAEDEGEIELELVDYGDADMFRIITTYEVEDWDQDAWENWDPEAPDADENMPEPVTVEMTDVEYVARVAGHMIYTTSFDVARDTVDRLEGRERGETIGDVREFVDARGTNPPSAHAYTVLLPKVFAADAGALENLPIPMGFGDLGGGNAIAGTLGLSDVTALSAALVSNAPDAIAEVRFIAHMKQQRGVFALITGDALPATPPSFVGPDATSLGVFRVNFAGIIPLVREALASFPDSPETDGMSMQFEQVVGMIEPLLNSIGPELIQVGTTSRPFSATSAGSLVAVSMKDANAVRQTLNTVGGMAGLMPRDFAGSQIWESQMFPVALGLGANHLFVGMTGAEAVEKAMLAASQPDAPKLADDPRFAAARRALGDGGIAMGWNDTKTALDFAAWTAENLEQVVRAQAASFGMPEDQVEEYVQFILDQAPESARMAPPVDSLSRVMGDVVSVFRSTSRGIEGTVQVLKAQR